MVEVLSLVGHYLIAARRGRTPWILGGLAALALGASALIAGRIGHDNTLYVWGVLWAMLLASSFAAVRIGALLPSDRESGRSTWLRAHALSPWQHRLAALLATLLLIGFACLFVALVATAVAHASGRATSWRSVETLPLDQDPVYLGSLSTSGSTSPLEWKHLRDHSLPSTLELDLRPHFYVVGVSHVDVNVTIGEQSVPRAIGPRGIAAFALPPHTTRASIAMRTPGARLRVASAKQTTEGPATLVVFLRLALVFSVCMAAVAPIALWCSRISTATTAVTLACVVLFFALVRGPLLGLTRDIQLEGLAAWAPRVIDGASQVVPRVPILDTWREASEGGTGGMHWRALLPALLYLGATSILAVVPWRRRA